MLVVSLHNPTKASVNHFTSDGKACASFRLQCKDGDGIDVYVSPDMADALLAAWKSLPYCETCKQRVEIVNEADECGDCHEARIREEYAKWRPIYDSEKRAGLLKTRDELNADLRAAGRGHLIGDTP